MPTTHRIKPITTERARSLRSEMTLAEQRLRHVLRSEQLQGHRFRRQHAIGPYLADFACIGKRLAIELDGGQHQDAAAYDGARAAFLQSQGWQVLRFWNNDVMGNLDGVFAAIMEAMQKRNIDSSATPHERITIPEQ